MMYDVYTNEMQLVMQTQMQFMMQKSCPWKLIHLFNMLVWQQRQQRVFGVGHTVAKLFEQINSFLNVCGGHCGKQYYIISVTCAGFWSCCEKYWLAIGAVALEQTLQALAHTHTHLQTRTHARTHTPLHHLLYAYISAGEGTVVQAGLNKVALYRDEDRMLHKMSGICTHLGCAGGWNKKEWSAGQGHQTCQSPTIE